MPASSSSEPRYIFNASAVAFGGQLTRPAEKPLRSAAATALSSSGGFSRQDVSGPEAKDYFDGQFFTFSEAHSSTEGVLTSAGSDGILARTTATSQLIGLQIASHSKTSPYILNSGTLNLEMTTESTSAGRQSYRRILTPTYKDVSLQTSDGRQIFKLNVISHPEIFCENSTQEEIVARLRDDAAFRNQYAHCFNFSEVTGSKGPMTGTFVTGLEFESGGKPDGVHIVKSNVLTIAGLGNIYFGEMYVSGKYQLASLLRCELDSNVSDTAEPRSASAITPPPPPPPTPAGSGNGSQVSNNGHWGH